MILKLQKGKIIKQLVKYTVPKATEMSSAAKIDVALGLNPKVSNYRQAIENLKSEGKFNLVREYEDQLSKLESNIARTIVKKNPILSYDYYPIWSADHPINWSNYRWDTEYNEAIKNKDKELIQQLRDLHFMAKALDNKLVDTNGNPITVWHGSPKKWNIFNYNLADPDDVIYFSTDKSYADQFTVDKKKWPELPKKSARSFYIYGENPIDIGFDMNHDSVKSGLRQAWMNNINADSVYGYDTIISKLKPSNGQEFGILHNTRMKLTNPITRDGVKIIPLSKRDDFTNPDIRYGFAIPLTFLGAGLSLSQIPSNKNGGVIKLQGAGLVPALRSVTKAIRKPVLSAAIARSLSKNVGKTLLEVPSIGVVSLDNTTTLPEIPTYNFKEMLDKAYGTYNYDSRVMPLSRPISEAEILGIPKGERNLVQPKNPIKISLINRSNGYLPIEGENFTLESPDKAERLATVHFTMNQPVTAHGGGSWDSASTTLLFPYGNIRKATGPVSIDIMDTFFPNYNGLKFSTKGAKVLTGDRTVHDYYTQHGVNSKFSEELEALLKDYKTKAGLSDKYLEEHDWMPDDQYYSLQKAETDVSDKIQQIHNDFVDQNAERPSLEDLQKLSKIEGLNIEVEPYKGYEASTPLEKKLGYTWYGTPQTHFNLTLYDPGENISNLPKPMQNYVKWIWEHKADYRKPSWKQGGKINKK